MTGNPFNDLKERWRAGGGINVPVKIETVLGKRQAREIRRALELEGTGKPNGHFNRPFLPSPPLGFTNVSAILYLYEPA